MKRVRKITALLLSMVMMLAIFTTACSNGKKEDAPTTKVEEAPASSKSQEDKTEKKPADETSREVTDVTIWTKDRHDEVFMTNLFERFEEENPDIKVNYEMYTDNYQQVIDIASNNGELPDIVCTFTPVIQNLMNRGDLLPLNDRLTGEQKDMFPENLFVNGINMRDGNIYSFPHTGNTIRLVYNKDLLADVGYDEAPVTLDEFVDAAIKISEKHSTDGIYGFALPLKNPSSGFQRGPVQIPALSGYPVLNGFDFSKGEYDYSSYKPVYEALRKIYDAEAAFPGTESLEIDPLRTQFADGKIGMYFTYSHSEYGVFTEQFPTEEEWAYAPVPVIEERNGTQNISAGFWYSITKNTKNEDAAWRVLEYMYNFDNSVAYHEQGLGVSVLPKVLEEATPPDAIAYTPYMAFTDKDAIWPAVPSGVTVEGSDWGESFAAYVFGETDDIDGIIADLNERYNAGYEKSIADEINEKVVYPNFEASDPAGTMN